MANNRVSINFVASHDTPVVEVLEMLDDPRIILKTFTAGGYILTVNRCDADRFLERLGELGNTELMPESEPPVTTE